MKSRDLFALKSREAVKAAGLHRIIHIGEMVEPKIKHVTLLDLCIGEFAAVLRSWFELSEEYTVDCVISLFNGYKVDQISATLSEADLRAIYCTFNTLAQGVLQYENEILHCAILKPSEHLIAIPQTSTGQAKHTYSLLPDAMKQIASMAKSESELLQTPQSRLWLKEFIFNLIIQRTGNIWQDDNTVSLKAAIDLIWERLPDEKRQQIKRDELEGFVSMMFANEEMGTTIKLID